MFPSSIPTMTLSSYVPSVSKRPSRSPVPSRNPSVLVPSTSPSISSIPSELSIQEKVTTIFLALSGSASELSSLSKDELDSMKDGFQSFFAGRTLSTSFQSVVVSVMFDGDYIIEQQQEQVKEQENSRRSLQDGALRLVLEIQTVVRRIGAEAPVRPRYKVPAPDLTSTSSRYTQIKDQLKSLKLSTVCEEAQCPNIGECWNGGTGTIMLLGDTCTRGCMFCAVNTSSTPAPPDPFEPFHTAQALIDWGVDYIVLTSVDRDDIEDGGASHFANTVELLKQNKPELLVECLVSCFAGMADSVRTLSVSGLDVYAHNVETVERLQGFVRDKRANYQQSLFTLQKAKEFNPNLYTKTSIMLGLGETEEEVLQTMRDLRAIDVDVLTLGQYIRPTEHHLSVVEYISQEQFDKYKKIGQEEMGFKYVASGPLVRSSYKAGEFYMEHMIKQDQRRRLSDGSG